MMRNDEALGLLGSIAKGDKTAFERFYRAYNRSVYAFLLNQLQNPVDAEEVASETLFDVWRGAGSFNGKSQVRTWVFGIARNKMLMRFRSRGGIHEDINDHTEALISGDLCPIDVIANSERKAKVRKCMERLSPSHRECLHLVFFESYSLSEVSEHQQIPSGTVKTRLHHARLKIKNCLASLLRDEDPSHLQARS
jgi:RNA polymerase sigma-70 factor, ECF subfamily